MTTLYFNLDPELAVKAGPEVPVEVAQRDMVLMGSTTSSRPLQLPAGEYFVTARVPGFDGLTQRITITEGQGTAHVRLRASSSGAAFPLTAARQAGVLGSVKRYLVETPINFVRGSIFPVTLRVFRGNVFEHLQVVPVSRWDTEGTAGQVKVWVPPGEQQSIAQVLMFGLAPINIVLPVAAQVGCFLFVHPNTQPAPSVACSIQHEQGRLLLGWRQSGHLWEAEAMLRSNALKAEQLLSDKDEDPIAAAVGAYTLLRLNNLDALHDWTENLMNRFPLLPDGAVVRGEHLARLGRHAEAADAFLAARHRGLPIFLDGVSFLTSRLDLYAGAKRMVDAAQATRLRNFQEELGKIAPFLNSRRSVSSFTGIDPMRPDHRTVRDTKVSGAQRIA
jgi:hypothetical protein